MRRGVLRTLIADGAERLRSAGIGSARQEAEWLLSALLDLPPLDIYLCEVELSASVEARFLAQLDARASGVPLQYLTGRTEFFGARFAVESGVFIPRPETEAIVEAALGALRRRQRAANRPLRLVDAGTGSGCIAVTLARELPACLLTAIELSWTSLCIARRNILQHKVEQRVQLVQGRWLAPMCGGVDGIISNPPYVPSEDMDRLPLDVRREPCMSLDGGAEGMRDVWSLIEETPRVLLPGGVLALECGEEQVPRLVERLAASAWVKSVIPVADLAGRPRGVLAHRCE